MKRMHKGVVLLAIAAASASGIGALGVSASTQAAPTTTAVARLVRDPT